MLPEYRVYLNENDCESANRLPTSSDLDNFTLRTVEIDF